MFKQIKKFAIIAGCLGASMSAQATLVTHTDSFGIKWTIASDGINSGTTIAPIFDIKVLADTSGFHTGDFTYANAYINTVTIQAAAPVISGSVTGPGGAWTNVIGGEDRNGCNGTGAASGFDCAYFTWGYNPVTAAGVLMNIDGGLLNWDFKLGFAADTTAETALSFLSDGSHLKSDYFGFKTTTTTKRVCTVSGSSKVCHNETTSSTDYAFLGQISDAVTINKTTPAPAPAPAPAPSPTPTAIPEPTSMALLAIGLIGLGVASRRKYQV